MAFWKKLFGGAGSGTGATAPEPEMHQGFAIYPEPQQDGPRWRLAGRIEKEIGGELRSHLMIRADTFDDRDTAIAETIAKARMVIDQQGDRIFS